MDEKQPTNQEMLETILTSFSDIETRMATKDDLKSFATKDYLDEKLKSFATKEDLRVMQHQILDGMDDKLADLKGDMIVAMRKEDYKVTELIKMLRQKEILNENESRTLLNLQPFPQT